ncbi:hypothetical protein BGX20_002746 [Mortierella sp. AD010]|nr:hypothetical protein BGX20_002746 [Mortierella sp. AD010]
MRSRYNLFSAASLAFTGLVGLLSTAPSPAQADLICTQTGSDTFHIGSTIKFGFNDTQTTDIEYFNLNLYCYQSGQLVETLMILNSSSPSPAVWVANSTLTTLSTDCPYNQYQGVFEWSTTDPDTDLNTVGKVACKVMLLVGTGSQASAGVGSDDSDLDTDEPDSGDIEVTEKTKRILIGVGCAVLALILAGFVGFYYIRYSNKRAAQDQINKKLREPMQSGPLFPPIDRSRDANSRYNELSSVAPSSVASPALTSRTEMGELGGSHLSPALGSRSPTPIAAAHAKLAGQSGGHLSASQSFNNERPGSLLTSSFVPIEDGRNPFERDEQQQTNGSYHY